MGPVSGARGTWPFLAAGASDRAGRDSGAITRAATGPSRAGPSPHGAEGTPPAETGETTGTVNRARARPGGRERGGCRGRRRVVDEKRSVAVGGHRTGEAAAATTGRFARPRPRSTREAHRRRGRRLPRVARAGTGTGTGTGLPHPCCAHVPCAKSVTSPCRKEKGVELLHVTDRRQQGGVVTVGDHHGARLTKVGVGTGHCMMMIRKT